MMQGTGVSSVKSETTDIGGLFVTIEVERTGPSLFRLAEVPPNPNDLPDDVADALLRWVIQHHIHFDRRTRLDDAGMLP